MNGITVHHTDFRASCQVGYFHRAGADDFRVTNSAGLAPLIDQDIFIT